MTHQSFPDWEMKIILILITISQINSLSCANWVTTENEIRSWGKSEFTVTIPAWHVNPHLYLIRPHFTLASLSLTLLSEQTS